MSNVRNFGAVGDGKTDDTAAIRHAVGTAADGLLEFPRGEYRITQTVEIALDKVGPMSIVSAGGLGRVVMAGAGPAFRVVGTHTKNALPANVPAAIRSRERMTVVEGIEIVGAHPDADGLEFVRCVQPTVRGVLIRECRHGVVLAERDRNFLMDGCHVYDCRGVGVYLKRVNLHQAIISASHISYCKGGGIKVEAGEIRNLQIVGNDIEYNHNPDAESADVWIDAADGSIREGTIVGNTIQALYSPGGANVRLRGPADINKVGMFTVTGNHISNQEVNIHLVNCRGVVVEGNSVAVARRRSIVIDGCRHVVVGPNSLDHNPDYKGEIVDGVTLRNADGCSFTGVLVEGSSAGSEKEGGAIELFDCRETNLTGCQVFEPKVRGVWLGGCRNTVITGCTVLDRTGVGSMLSAVHSAGKTTGTVLSGNKFGKGKQGDVVQD